MIGYVRGALERVTLRDAETGATPEPFDAVGRKDAYFAFWKMYEQLACMYPQVQATPEEHNGTP